MEGYYLIVSTNLVNEYVATSIFSLLQVSRNYQLAIAHLNSY